LSKFSALCLQFGDQLGDFEFLFLERSFYLRELSLELYVLLVLYNERWVPNDGAEEFLFCDLFEVGETELGEEFLWSS
jgi:hypothetical protein